MAGGSDEGSADLPPEPSGDRFLCRQVAPRLSALPAASEPPDD